MSGNAAFVKAHLVLTRAEEIAEQHREGLHSGSEFRHERTVHRSAARSSGVPSR